MAMYGGVKKRQSFGTATVKRSAKPSSSGGSSSSGRVPANSYGTGEKYLGGNTMQRADGSTYEVKGEFTSPSGKVSYVDDNGDITTVSSRDKSQNGTVYTKQPDGSYTSNFSQKVARDYANDYANMQVEALREAMGSNIDALNAAYDQSAQRLSNAAKEAKRQAYVNQQKALNTLPQAMAAAGYNGGVTETTAAGLAADYQNALTDVDNNTAEEMARLQADKANGIANVSTTYNTQIANALQQAAQFEQQQRQYAEEMALRQRAQAFEEQKYLNSLNRAGTGGKTVKTYGPNGLTLDELTSLTKAGIYTPEYSASLINGQTPASTLGYSASAQSAINRMNDALERGIDNNTLAQMGANEISRGNITADEYRRWLNRFGA